MISLDFELYWGMADINPLDAEYKAILTRTREEVIPRMLERFEHHGVHATWATVGYLFYETIDQLRAEVPEVLPAYDEPSRSSYQYLGEGGDETADPYRLGPSLVSMIQATPGQEIGSHSFSHFYCLEPGATDEAFAADLRAWAKAAVKHGVEPTSICFGRNQYREGSVDAAIATGFRAYRGNEPSWLYQPRASTDETFPRKVLRFADTYAPLTRHHCPDPKSIGPNRPVNVASSRFLRAYRHDLRWFEPLKARRIFNGMRYAARQGRIFHLWWHPQDFASLTEQNFELLERILQRYSDLRDEGLMVSKSMGEVATIVNAG